VFPEKRLQTIENKGNERRKEYKETTKRLQADANKSVGSLEGLKVCGWEPTSRYTPVVIDRVRKPLKMGGIAARRCAKECVIA